MRQDRFDNRAQGQNMYPRCRERRLLTEMTSDSGISLPADGVLQPGHNATLSALNLSARASLNCDEGWGRNLNLQMCGEAVASIPPAFKTGSTPVTFGPREAESFDIGLPRRWMSCESSFLTTGKDVTALIFE